MVHCSCAFNSRIPRTICLVIFLNPGTWSFLSPLVRHVRFDSLTFFFGTSRFFFSNKAFGLYCAFCPAIITLDLMMLHHCRKLKAFTLGINQLGGSLAEGQQNHQAAPVIREIELAKNEPVVEATVMKTAPVTESTLAAMVTGGPFKEAGRQLTLVERLRELQTVRDQGLISNQEFEAAKVEVLKNYTAV